MSAALAGLAALVDDAGSARAAATRLRERLPRLRVLVMDPFELRHEVPVLRTSAVDVHLMTSDGGCWTFTRSPDDAGAIALCDRGD